MSQCPNLPSGKVREIIQRTNETGNEHGFARCADGSVSEIASGGKTGMNIGGAIDECDLDDGPVHVVHTHPNGVADLSGQDRKVAADENVASVCVAVDGGELYCEMTDSCESEVDE